MMIVQMHDGNIEKHIQKHQFLRGGGVVGMQVAHFGHAQLGQNKACMTFHAKWQRVADF